MSIVAVTETGSTDPYSDSVMTSADGVTWTSRTSVARKWQSVAYTAYGGGLFVAVSASGNSVYEAASVMTYVPVS